MWFNKGWPGPVFSLPLPTWQPQGVERNADKGKPISPADPLAEHAPVSPNQAAGLRRQAVGKGMFQPLGTVTLCVQGTSNRLSHPVPCSTSSVGAQHRQELSSQVTALPCSAGAPAHDLLEVCMKEFLSAVHLPRESSNADLG